MNARSGKLCDRAIERREGVRVVSGREQLLGEVLRDDLARARQMLRRRAVSLHAAPDLVGHGPGFDDVLKPGEHEARCIGDHRRIGNRRNGTRDSRGAAPEIQPVIVSWRYDSPAAPGHLFASSLSAVA